MNCKRNKPKHHCGTRTPASCVFYNLELPDISKLKILDDCITIEETTDDIYQMLEYVFDHLNTEELGKKCLTYKTTKNRYRPNENVILIKDVLLKLEEEICKFKDRDCSEIDKCIIDKLDFKCLVDPCGENISSLSQLLQILINEICALKNPVN